MAASTAITRISSINVKPCRDCAGSFLRIPIGKVIVTTRPAVGSHRHQVVIRVVSSWTSIDIGVPPRIGRYPLLQIGALPVLRSAWRINESTQAGISLGIKPVVDFERIEREFD